VRYSISFSNLLSELRGRTQWPRRRTWLPGNGRLRELVKRPQILTSAARPSRRKGLGNIQDGERLIGLLMIRDESDILDASLRCSTRWFDRILVLDGSTDPAECERTDAILARFPEVVFHARDHEVGGGAPVTDGARHFLLAEARRRYGVDNWIGLLHADEFLDQDPRPMLAAMHPTLAPSVRVRLVHAFLHTSNEATWQDTGERPLRERLTHCMWPGVPESRFFFDDGTREYQVGHHGKTIPTSLRSGPLVDGYVIVQYNERSPEQLRARASQRMEAGWQLGHYARFLDDPPMVFTPTLDLPNSPFAPEFAGDPEGPFTPLAFDDLPICWDRQAPEAEPDPASPTDPARIDLSVLVDPGGLLDLIDHPSPAAVARFGLRVRDPEHPWAEALGLGQHHPWHGVARVAVLARLRHTTLVLRSRRTTRAQRQTAVTELLTATHRGHQSWAYSLCDAGAERMAGLWAEAPAP
jgi:hypothetical protein